MKEREYLNKIVGHPHEGETYGDGWLPQWDPAATSSFLLECPPFFLSRFHYIPILFSYLCLEDFKSL